MGSDNGKIRTIADLTPDPANARAHTARGVGMIEEALNEVGAARSIVIDERGVILAGNATVEAAAAAGIERVKVVDANGNELVAVRRSGLTEQAKKRLALYDNRTGELSDWSGEVLAAIQQEDEELLRGLFRDDELEAILGDLADEPTADPGAQIDKAAGLQEKWQVERGQVWEVGKHRLMCGDSTKVEDVERLLHGDKPNLTITDPPYGVDYDPAWRQEAAAKGLLAYAARRIGEVANDDRVDWSEAFTLCPGSVVYCWHAGRLASSTQLMLESAGFELRCQIIWSKPHFPISRGHYHWRHEPCWYAVRKGKQASWVGDRKQTTVWEIALDRNVDGGHSTQKPVECFARAVRNHEGDVYDPFLGTGTALVAAEQLERIGHKMEIEPKYCAITLERLTGMGLEAQLA